MGCSCNKNRNSNRTIPTVASSPKGKIVSANNANIAPMQSRNVTGMDAERRKVEKSRRDAIRRTLGK